MSMARWCAFNVRIVSTHAYVVVATSIRTWSYRMMGWRPAGAIFQAMGISWPYKIFWASVVKDDRSTLLGTCVIIPSLMSSVRLPIEPLSPERRLLRTMVSTSSQLWMTEPNAEEMEFWVARADSALFRLLAVADKENTCTYSGKWFFPTAMAKETCELKTSFQKPL